MRYEKETLAPEFTKLWQQVGCSENADRVFARLVNESDKKPRSYHTLENHIGTMWTEYQHVRSRLPKPVQVGLAVWFHDAIYNPRRNDNEEKSAALAGKCLRQAQGSDSMITDVESMIRASKHFSPKNYPADQSTHFFLDMDLAILGYPRKQYDLYEKGVLDEYHFAVDEQGRDVFIDARRKVLEELNSQRPLYKTEYFQQKYEAQAHQNMERSLNRLRRGILPGERLGLYAGSFDPLTNGHLWVIEQSAAAFDRVVVAIGNNPFKSSRFNLEERLEMITDSTRHLGNVDVDQFTGEFAMVFADRIGAQFLVRGLRDIGDLEYEKTIVELNNEVSDKLLSSPISIVHFMSPSHLTSVSSTTVMGLVGFNGWKDLIGNYLPVPVQQKVIQNYE